MASRLGTGRRTFYDRVSQGAELAYALSRGIAPAQAGFQVMPIENAH